MSIQLRLDIKDLTVDEVPVGREAILSANTGKEIHYQKLCISFDEVPKDQLDAMLYRFQDLLSQMTDAIESEECSKNPA